MQKVKLILASNSPRRKQLLAGLGVDFDVVVMKGVDESYPDDLEVDKVAGYIAGKKAGAYKDLVDDNTIVITADTVVVLDGKVMGKPAGHDEACQMLRDLGGHTHQVITGVCLVSKNEKRCISVTSEVTFKQLSNEEIEFYVSRYKPYDKAGAYGIQEWIGYVGVTALKGSYFNVMGLPVQRIYQEIVDMCGSNIFIHDDKALP